MTEGVSHAEQDVRTRIFRCDAVNQKLRRVAYASKYGSNSYRVFDADFFINTDLVVVVVVVWYSNVFLCATLGV